MFACENETATTKQNRTENMEKNGELNTGKCYVRVNHTRYL